MKTIKVLICISFCLIWSCKKNEKIDCWFGINLPDNYRDSISSIVVRYSDFSDFKNEQDINYPDNYKNSVELSPQSENFGYPSEIHYGYLTLEKDHKYVIKKFDLVNSAGKVFYYLPWVSDTIHTNNIPRLPFIFKASSMSIGVAKYLK